MSETVTVASGITGTIYGTFAGALAYLGGSFGDAYTAWLALSTADQKRTLIAAARYLDRQSWIDDVDTLALRDAYVLDDATTYPFQLASYELAAAVADDADVLVAPDTGTNVARVFAGGAGVDFANPTSVRGGTASVLPPILQALIGGYLATSATAGPDGGSGESGSCRNPFADCADYDRNRPF